MTYMVSSMINRIKNNAEKVVQIVEIIGDRMNLIRMNRLVSLMLICVLYLRRKHSYCSQQQKIGCANMDNRSPRNSLCSTN